MQGGVLSALIVGPPVASQSSGMQHSSRLLSKPVHLTRLSKLAWQWISSNREILTVTYSKPEKRVCVSVLKNGYSIPVKFETLPAELKSAENSKELNQILAQQHVRVLSSSRHPKICLCTKLRREWLSPEGRYAYDQYSEQLTSLKDHLEGLANPVAVKEVLDLFNRKSEEVLDISVGLAGWMKELKVSLETQRHVHELSQAVTKVAKFLIKADDVGDFCQELREELENLIPYPNIDENFPDELTNFFSHPAIARLTTAKLNRLYKEMSHVGSEEARRKIMDKYFTDLEDKELLDGLLVKVIDQGLLNSLAGWKQSDTSFLGRAIFFSNKYLGIITHVQRIRENTLAFYLDNKFKVAIDINKSVTVYDSNEKSIFTESENRVNNCIKFKKAGFDAFFNSFVSRIQQETIDDITRYGVDFHSKMKENLSILINNIRSILVEYSRPSDDESLKKVILQVPAMFNNLKSSPQDAEEIIITTEPPEGFEDPQKALDSKEILVLRDPMDISNIEKRLQYTSPEPTKYSKRENNDELKQRLENIENTLAKFLKDHQNTLEATPGVRDTANDLKTNNSNANIISDNSCHEDVDSGDSNLLSVELTNPSDEDLFRLARNTPRLTELHLVADSEIHQISDAGLTFLATRCRLLTNVTLNCCIGITDISLSNLASNCPDLINVTLENCWKITAATLITLATNCHKLTSLAFIHNYDMPATWITDATLTALGTHCPELTSLTLKAGLEITDAALVTLMTRCPGLTNVKLGLEKKITEATLIALVMNCPRLNSLSFGWEGLVMKLDATLEASLYSGLTNLNLCGGAWLSGTGLASLAKYCPNLTSIELTSCYLIMEDDIITLAKNCPNLTRVALRGSSSDPNDITDTGLIGLAKICSKLISVEFQHCNQITNAGLAALLKHCVELTSLRISPCYGDKITDKDIIALAKHCSNLTRVNLYGKDTRNRLSRELFSINLSECKQVICADLAALVEGFSRLTYVNLGNCQDITDTGLAALAKSCPGLTNISLSWCNLLTDTGLAALAEHCTQLADLTLDVCNKITDKGLNALMTHCPSLTRVKVIQIGSITEGSLARIKAKYPAIEFETSRTAYY